MGAIIDAVGDDRTVALIKNSARNRRYELLLGAGASHGASNPSGPLPLGNGLISALVEEYSDRAPMNDGDSLLRCYQRALTAAGEESVYSFLRRKFHESEHQPWFGNAACFPWRRVWTLNIDDAFERSYESSKSTSHPKMTSISWSDPFVEDVSNLQVVHLHGKVDTPSVQPIVFSFAEYDKKASDKVVWDQILRSVFVTAPFVVVGAGVFGDPDMESLLINRRHQASTPSFVVNPNISEADAWELRQSGLIVVKTTAQDFFAEWAELCDFPDNLADLFVDASLRLPQLRPRLIRSPGESSSTHDIFSGDEPKWVDAVKDRIAEFEWMTAADSQVGDWSEKPDARLLKVVGTRFGGVSSGLHFIIKRAADRGVRCFWFDRSSRFNAADLAIHAQANGPILVAVESAADYADDIDEALRVSAELNDVGLIFLAGEINRNELKLDGRLRGAYPVDTILVPGKLLRPDARSLARKLLDNARAGEFELDPSPDRLIASVLQRDVFSAMLQVSGGSGFTDRMRCELTKLVVWQRKLVLLLQMASAGQLSISVPEASVAIGVNADTITNGVRTSSALSALVEDDGGQLHARQRDHALRTTISTLGPEAAFDFLSQMVNDLHPLVQTQSLRARNRAALLVGHLMGSKFLARQFPEADLEKFYERLQPQYGTWNGRYWEQRALLHKALSQWSRAESFAARAVTLFDGAYTRTTYGTILINRSSYYASLGDSRWHTTYLRGKRELEEANARSEEKFVSQLAFLTASLELIEQISSRGGTGEDTSFMEILDDWTRAYSYLRITVAGSPSASDAERRIEMLSRRFQRLEGSDGVNLAVKTDQFVGGYDYDAIVAHRVNGGFKVDTPGVGEAILSFKKQRQSARGLPKRVPNLSPGDRVRIHVISTEGGTPKAIFLEEVN